MENPSFFDLEFHISQLEDCFFLAEAPEKKIIIKNISEKYCGKLHQQIH